MTEELYNSGKNPIIIGATPEGHPLVVHPGKYFRVEPGKVKDVKKINKALLTKKEYEEFKKSKNKEKKDKEK